MLTSWHFKPSPFMWGLSAWALVQGIARSRESQTCNSKGYFRSGLQRIISSAFNKLCKKKPLYYALNCRCLYKRSQIPAQAGFLLLFTLELYSCRSFIPPYFPYMLAWCLLSAQHGRWGGSAPLWLCPSRSCVSDAAVCTAWEQGCRGVWE